MTKPRCKRWSRSRRRHWCNCKVQETRIHNELFQLLTADQQAKMKEFEANREARMQQRIQNAPPAPQE
jgi:Spy/CpxP family protein refolding chaperone